MRLALRLSGTLLMLASLLGLATLAVLVLNPETPAPAALPALITHILGATNAQPLARVTELGSTWGAETQPQVRAAAQVEVADAREGAGGAITHVEIPSIGLSADVVPARLVQRAGGLTWDVPAFKIGHAESTAAAGQPGNAVLLGHVTSVHSGNVFADLDQVQVGQPIHVYSDAREFTYTVVSTTRVARTDTSALEQSDTPAVSLITCTGIWLPTIWDYTERLVVRGALTRDR